MTKQDEQLPTIEFARLSDIRLVINSAGKLSHYMNMSLGAAIKFLLSNPKGREILATPRRKA